MSEPTYTDLKITDGDIELDVANIPVQIHDSDVIAQDVRHMILESGLLPVLVAENSEVMRGLTLKHLRMLIESDSRIIPGSSAIKESSEDAKTIILTITAETEFGKVTVGTF